MSQFFTLLTTTGQGLLANAIAYGEPLTIAELAIGDGGGTLPSPDASVTRLVNEVRRGPINQTTTDPDNPNWTVVEQVLPPDVGGWTIREVGLYDTDGNLIAYGNYPETYKPQLSEGSARTQTIRFVMEVTDTSAVTLKIDPSVVMASRRYVDDQLEAHAQSRTHPTADTKNQGMMRFATLAESRKGEESKAAQTPAGGKAQLDDHRKEDVAHKAEQITITEPIRQVPDAKTVEDTLAGLGDFAAAGFQNIAVFDKAGVTEWEVPDALRLGLRKAHVVVIGGGGGGGRRDSNAGGGGGGGQSCICHIDLSGIDNVTITVGAGGVGGQSNNTGGANGGISSFGSFVSAYPGEGASGDDVSPGAGGNGTSFPADTINIPGQEGSFACIFWSNGLNINPLGGNGGSSYLGLGATGNTGPISNVNAAKFGAGGGGNESGPAGNGGDGIIIVRW